MLPTAVCSWLEPSFSQAKYCTGGSPCGDAVPWYCLHIFLLTLGFFSGVLPFLRITKRAPQLPYLLASTTGAQAALVPPLLRTWARSGLQLSGRQAFTWQWQTISASAFSSRKTFSNSSNSCMHHMNRDLLLGDRFPVETIYCWCAAEKQDFLFPHAPHRKLGITV